MFKALKDRLRGARSIETLLIPDLLFRPLNWFGRLHLEGLFSLPHQWWKDNIPVRRQKALQVFKVVPYQLDFKPECYSSLYVNTLEPVIPYIQILLKAQNLMHLMQ